MVAASARSAAPLLRWPLDDVGHVRGARSGPGAGRERPLGSAYSGRPHEGHCSIVFSFSRVPYLHHVRHELCWAGERSFPSPSS